MNTCESDKLKDALCAYGMRKANSTADADIVILNTCSVRAQAEQKAFSYLGRVEEFKQLKPNVKMVVIGCMAQRLGAKIKKRFKSVDLVVGISNTDDVVLKIINLLGINNPQKRKKLGKQSEIARYVTIMKGCNNYCSYCVVPFVRGREISLNADEILNECSLLAQNGAREIMLLGQNVNSYRYENIDFASLIKKIAAIKDLERIRFMTNHPKDLNDDLIDTMAIEPKICSHIHLPMQSASNKILKAMNRKYTFEHYLELIKKLRSAMPNISVTTDIIVGFPGETESDFQDTLRATQEIRFGGLYVFRYSPRHNTDAAKMIDDVPLEEKKRRHAIILGQANKISAEIVSKMVGSKQQVLTEKIENGIIEAKTRGGRKVFISGGGKEDIGKQFNVYIKEAKINSLFGDIL
jgi:tRNA-2-methylthio-N6-dimethylallyladenosine synthase